MHATPRRGTPHIPGRDMSHMDSAPYRVTVTVHPDDSDLRHTLAVVDVTAKSVLGALMSAWVRYRPGDAR